MMNKRFSRILLTVEAIYIAMTALWPIIDIKSFMEVTGYKTDVWLVKTVGALLIPIALTLFAYRDRSEVPREGIILAMTTPGAFILIDVYYVQKDLIPPIYLVDAIVEALILGWWFVLLLARKRK